MPSSSLVPLADREHGTIYLADGSPASHATARVFTRRKGELVELPVWADAEKTRRLAQPLTADRDGRLPGLIHERPIEVEATWRGRTINSATVEALQETAQRARDAEQAAHAAGEARIAQEARQAREREKRAERAAATAAKVAEVEREREAERRRLERVARVEREKQAAADLQARERASAAAEESFSLSPTIPRREPLTLVIIDSDLNEVAEITVPAYEPNHDSNYSMDVLQIAPGFGIDAETGLAYYDTNGPTEGEEAVVGVVPPFYFVAVTP